MFLSLCRRFFQGNGFGGIPTKTPLESRGSLLESLSAPTSFKPENYSSLIKSLYLLYTNNNKSDFSVKKYPEARQILTNFQHVILNFTPEQLCMFAKNLGALSIADDALWEQIESQFTRKLYKECDAEKIAMMVSGAGRSKRTNPDLWVSIERAITTNVYPTHGFSADQIRDIIFYFGEMKVGSKNLFSSIRENLIAVIDDVKPQDLGSIMQIYMYRRDVDAELVVVLSSHAVRVRNLMAGKMLQNVLVALIRLSASDETIEELEEELLQKIGTLGLKSLSIISHSYGTHYRNLITEQGQKREIMEMIERYVADNQQYLVTGYHGKTLEEDMVKLMWGLSAGNVVKSLKMWKEFGRELKTGRKYKNVGNIKYAKEILENLKNLNILD